MIRKTSLFLFLITFLLSSSCKREKDTLAEITVFDNLNNKVLGAEVIVYGEPTNWDKVMVVNDTAITDLNGIARFNYNHIYNQGQNGVAILNIKVKKGSKIGEGIIHIEEETVSKERVYLHD